MVLQLSLNVSGFTTLNNTTNIHGSLYISGLNVLSTLNSYSTSLTSLYSSTEEIENVLITLGTGLSTLNMFFFNQYFLKYIEMLKP